MKLTQVITELRRLNEPVPRPLRLPTEAEVDAAEQRLGLKFLPSYRYFLLHASDVTFGTLEPAVVTPDGAELDLVQMATAAWQAGVPKELLPFCESNGDYFCLHTDGRVIYWSPDGPTDESWPDLADWVRQVWMEAEEDEEDAE